MQSAEACWGARAVSPWQPQCLLPPLPRLAPARSASSLTRPTPPNCHPVLLYTQLICGIVAFACVAEWADWSDRFAYMIWCGECARGRAGGGRTGE